jgi:hypothetical protein
MLDPNLEYWRGVRVVQRIIDAKEHDAARKENRYFDLARLERARQSGDLALYQKYYKNHRMRDGMTWMALAKELGVSGEGSKRECSMWANEMHWLTRRSMQRHVH